MKNAFQKKAGFVSLEWYPVLANYRRNGYDFDALYDDGMAAHKDKYIYDTIITRLQMKTYITIDTFEYKKDKSGQKYGWGVAKYTTPEEKYGKAPICTCYDEQPLKSKQKIFDYLSRLFPDVDEKIINKMIG